MEKDVFLLPDFYMFSIACKSSHLAASVLQNHLKKLLAPG